MAEIKSESVAGFIPESVAGLLRNQQLRQKTRFASIGLGVLNDRIGFRGADGFDQAARDASIIAYPRAETLLSRTVGIDITGRIRDASAWISFHALKRPAAKSGSVGGGRRARSVSIHKQSAVRVASSRACAKAAMIPSATPFRRKDKFGRAETGAFRG